MQLNLQWPPINRIKPANRVVERGLWHALLVLLLANCSSFLKLIFSQTEVMGPPKHPNPEICRFILRVQGPTSSPRCCYTVGNQGNDGCVKACLNARKRWLYQSLLKVGELTQKRVKRADKPSLYRFFYASLRMNRVYGYNLVENRIQLFCNSLKHR